jgi:predicted MFS family arabinose efflux permease
MDLIGRKKLLIAANALSLVGWTVIVFASSFIVVCVGRFLGGVAVAAITVTGKQRQGDIQINILCTKTFFK